MFDSTINPYISDKPECIFTNHLNLDYFKSIATAILNTRYPRQCPACNCRDYKTISTRETEVVCRDCKTHYSITAYTPLHHFKLPLWVFGYLVKEAMDLHPQPLTGTHIKRKLGVGSATSTMLKRRLQVFLSDLMPGIKGIMAEEIGKDFPEGFVLPEPGADIKHHYKSINKPA